MVPIPVVLVTTAPPKSEMLRLLLQPGDNYENRCVPTLTRKRARSRAMPSGPELAAFWLRQVGRTACERAAVPQ